MRQPLWMLLSGMVDFVTITCTPPEPHRPGTATYCFRFVFEHLSFCGGRERRWKCQVAEYVGKDISGNYNIPLPTTTSALPQK